MCNEVEASAATALRTLLAERAKGKTVCPSEVARRIDPHNWHQYMPLVHDAVTRLVNDGEVATTWRGQPVDRRRGGGPYRIRRRDDVDVTR